MALPNPPVLTNVIGKTEALEVYWDQVTGSVLNYIIYYGTAPGIYSGSLVVPVGSLADPAIPQYDVTGLVNNATYWVTISAVEVGTETETIKSNELSAITSSTQIVAQPSNLMAAANNASVTLSWNSDAVDGFRIEYTRDISEPRQWNGVGATQGDSPIEIEGNIGEYTITGLENNNGIENPYFFRVSARKLSTYSPPTEEVFAIPQSDFTTPLSGDYVKIAFKTGLNVIAVPLLPKSFTPDADNMLHFLGASTILWKHPGQSSFASRNSMFGGTLNKTLEPMEAVLVIMPPNAPTKYLIGDSWKNV